MFLRKPLGGNIYGIEKLLIEKKKKRWLRGQYSTHYVTKQMGQCRCSGPTTYEIRSQNQMLRINVTMTDVKLSLP